MYTHTHIQCFLFLKERFLRIKWQKYKYNGQDIHFIETEQKYVDNLVLKQTQQKTQQIHCARQSNQISVKYKHLITEFKSVSFPRKWKRKKIWSR